MTLLFEDYVKNPVIVGRQICDFLEVDSRIALSLERPRNTAKARRIKRWPWVNTDSIKRFPSPVAQGLERALTKPLPVPQMSHEAYSHAMAVLTEDVDELRKLLDRDLSEWRLNF